MYSTLEIDWYQISCNVNFDIVLPLNLSSKAISS